MPSELRFKWDSHMLVVNELKKFLSTEALVDATLVCDGQSLKAHKIILSAYSPFFKSLFLENPCKHPIVILKDMKYTDLKSVLDFMYSGEVNMAEDQVSTVIKTAQILKVKGLGEVEFEDNLSHGPVENSSLDESESSTSNVSKNKSGGNFDFKKTDNNHVMNEFKSFLSTEAMADVTLGCDGRTLKAHKIILSAYSPLFKSLFLENPCKHPIVILKDIKYSELKSLINFMYCSEVKIADDLLSVLIKTARTLQVKLLAEMKPQSNLSSDKSENLINGESENQSGDESSQPDDTIGDSNWTISQEQSLSYQNEDAGYVKKIKQENMFDSTEFNTDIPMVPLQSHEANLFTRPEQNWIVEQNFHKNVPLNKSFKNSKSNSLLRQILDFPTVTMQSHATDPYFKSRQDQVVEQNCAFSLQEQSSVQSNMELDQECSDGENVNSQAITQYVVPCGCRNNCLSRFTDAERQLLVTYHKSIKPKMKQASYFLSLITINKTSKRTHDDAQKHIDYKFMYKIKIGRKELNVCMVAFLLLHDIDMSLLNDLQLVLQTEQYDKNALTEVVYPRIEGQEESEDEYDAETERYSSLSPASSVRSNSGAFESLKIDDEVRKKLSKKVPAIFIKKADAGKMKITLVKKEKKTSNEKKNKKANSSASKKGGVRKKLRDFPLVVKSLNEVAETLLIDLHSLLFSSIADSDEMKDNILNFDGFKFSANSEEYEERNEFLQRMSFKLLTDVGRAFSIGVRNNRTKNIQNILSFLMKPDESFLRVPLKSPATKKDIYVRKKLRDFPLVAKSLNEAAESVLINLHHLLYSCSPHIDTVIEDILDFNGFKFEATSAEYGEKTAFLQSLTGKLLSDVARAFSLRVKKGRAQTIKHILSFLLKPDERFLRVPTTKNDGNVRKKLKDFPQVVASLDEVTDTLLLDLHFLLFSCWEDKDTMKDNILDFDGFKFSINSEDYIKKDEFLQRMSFNLLAEIATAFSLTVKKNRPENTQNILLFLLNPDERYLRPVKCPTTKVDNVRKKSRDSPPVDLPAPKNVMKKLKDFPLVVKSLNEVAETLLIDLHFLLFSSSADNDKVKDNILNFDGFKFSTDSEEYDERNDFLQRMSGKLLTDVARAFSISVKKNREETIQTILLFLQKPDESYLSALVSASVTLPDGEPDDSEENTDSDDEPITFEVVEKRFECIDLVP